MTPSGNNTRGRPVCNAWGKVFAQLSTLHGHFKSAHGKKRHPCYFCDSTFSSGSHIKRHPKITIKNLLNHQQTSDLLYHHRRSMNTHHQVLHLVNQLLQIPVVISYSTPKHSACLLLNDMDKRHRVASWFNALEYLPCDVQQVYIENWVSIKTHSNVNKWMSTYIVFHPSNEPFTPDWSSLLTHIFESHTKFFKGQLQPSLYIMPPWNWCFAVLQCLS